MRFAAADAMRRRQDYNARRHPILSFRLPHPQPQGSLKKEFRLLVVSSEIIMLLVNKIINIIELIVKKMNFYFFYFVTIFLFNSQIFIAI